MPWQSGNGNGGGPWGGGKGGSGGGSGGGRPGGPWGGGGQGGGGQGGGGGFGGGQTPPDIEEAIRRSQEKLKSMIPGGGLGGKAIALGLLVVVGLWLFSGFYRVLPDQQGVVLRFGEWVNQDVVIAPGLHWHLPYPIETVLTPSVAAINSIEIGFRGSSGGRTAQDRQEESLMLTGDQNIIDIDFTLFWKIKDAGRFLFNIREPESTVKIAAESAMREIIGRTDIQQALTQSRQDIEIRVRELLQSILDEYEAGIEITQIQLQQVQPPGPVIDAFNDVLRAIQDRDRLQNEARAYANDIIPRARGEAVRQLQNAQAYRERLINEAEGEAKRFLSVYEAYKIEPELTMRRMYLETMEEVFARTDKVIIDQNGQGVVPYLPLNELNRNRTSGDSQ